MESLAGRLSPGDTGRDDRAAWRVKPSWPSEI